MKQGARRRTFLASLAAAPLLPAALAQVAPNPPSPPSPAPSPEGAPGPMALALAEAARHRFGAHLEAGDEAEIAKAIDGNLQAADRLRAVPLGNSDEPVTTFAARPPAAPARGESAMSLGADVHFASVRALGAMLRQGKVTSVQLTEESLARLESLGPKLGALVTLMRDSALAEARARDAEAKAGRWRGPLHGIPYGAKDLLATRGVPTTWGAAPYRQQVFDFDATVIGRLREAGAVLVAKLAMVELAGGMGYNNPDASFTGPGRSPWNPAHWSGGSSSGSGAATAAGLVPFAIGSETSGSILTPATFCGLSGLRPTYGLVSRHGAMALCWTLDKLGPMCRTADDCALVLMAMAGADPADPTTVAGGFRYAPVPAARRARIGVLKNATARAQPEVQANFEASVAVLRTFADVEDGVEFPDYPYGPAVGIIVDAEGSAAFRSLIEGGGLKTAPREERPARRLLGHDDAGRRLRGRAPRARAPAPRAGHAARALRRRRHPDADRGRAAHRLRLRQATAAVAGPLAFAVARRRPARAAGHHPGREPRRPARGLRPQRLRPARAPDVAAAPRPGVLGGDPGGPGQPLPEGHGLARPPPGSRPPRPRAGARAPGPGGVGPRGARPAGSVPSLTPPPGRGWYPRGSPPDAGREAA